MKNPFLSGEKIYLRPLGLEDGDFLCQGENNEQVRHSLFLAFPVSPSEEREKIQRYISSQDTILFTIALKENDQPVGQAGFFRVDFVSRAAVFYLAILSPEHWGTGIGSEATRLMVDYAFSTLNLNRIQLHVNAENLPAIKIYQRNGFQKEGVLRQAMYRSGKYNDFWVMGILREDWRK